MKISLPCRVRIAIIVIVVITSFCLANAQNGPAIVVDSSATASAAPPSQRGTGRQNIASLTAGDSIVIQGSQSYTYTVPALHLPGRHGLDINLNLFYNSEIWPLTSNSTNADYDNPSLGFRLDFGMFTANVFMDADGTKHPLTTVPDVDPRYYVHYATTDSSYIQVTGSKFVGVCPGPAVCQQPNLTVGFKNGSQAIYENFDFQHGWQFRPIRFTDTHGNQITISYRDGVTLALGSVTDSIGRVINFTYDAGGRLTSFGYGQHVFTLSWNPSFQIRFNNGGPSGVVTLAPTSVLTGITRPSHTSVRFQYGDWGIVNEIDELSANGAVRYSTSYNFPSANAGPLTTNPTFTTQTVFDGVNNNVQWTFLNSTDSTTSSTTMTTTDPTGVVKTSVGDGNGEVIQQTLASPDSGGHLKIWRILNQTWGTDSAGNNPRLSAVSTVLEDGSASGVQYVSYDANGNATDVKDFDFSQPSAANLTLAPGTMATPGPLLRETIGSFAALTGIGNRPSTISIKDGQVNTISRTDYSYDAGSTTGVHGDVTSIIHYANAAAGSGGVTSSFTYDSYGNIVTSQQGCCGFTQTVFSSATNFAYPDSISVGPQGSRLTTAYTYNPDGSILSNTDPNGLVTTYAYDPGGRVTSVAQSPGITENSSFDDLAINASSTTSNTGNSLTQVSTVDGLGRVLSVQQLNGNTSLNTTTYVNDVAGRPVQISNPYVSGATPIFTVVQYDPLGRVIQVTPPAAAAGGSQNSYTASYAGLAVTFTDPAGRQRIHYSDALGRLLRVDEPGPKNGQSASASLTIAGTEQSVPSSSGSNGATAGTATVTIGGSGDRSTQVLTHPATSANVSVTIGGSDGTNVTTVCARTCHTVNTKDSGTMQFTVNAAGTVVGPVSVSYGSTSTPASLAAALFAAFPANSVVTMSNPNGSAAFTLTTTATGSTTNSATFSSSMASNCQPSDSTACFQGWTITPAQASFSGGSDNVFTTVYDTGNVTVSITANGTNYSKSSSYAQTTTPSSIANDLYNQFIADSGFSQLVRVNPPGAGSALQFTTVATGAGTNYPLSTSAATNSSNFQAGTTSFTVAPPGSGNFAAGQNGTLYDAGTVTATLNGFTDGIAPGKQVSYGQGSSAAGVASQLAALIHSDPTFPVDASVVSGSATISLTARDQGAVANSYVLSVSGSSSLSSSFPNPSFPNSPASTSAVSAGLSGGIDPTPSFDAGVALSTSYKYDPLSHLLQVTQGPQTRTYGYDSLGRLTSSCVPETAGQCATYSYTDFDGFSQKIDPRILSGTTHITTTFGYDSLNNVNDIRYNDGTPEATFTYGGQGAANYGAGRLISRTDGTGSQSYKYDPQGRIAQISRTIGAVTYSVGYAYTASGQLSTITYPSGRAVAVGRDGADRLTSVSFNSTNLFNIGSYNAAGQPVIVSFTNGMQGTYGYDRQQRLSTLQFANSSGSVLNLLYNYGTSNNNGQVLGVTDQLVGAQSTSYVYDELGRLRNAQTNNLTAGNTWQLRFTYDRFGNRLSQVPVAGTALMPLSETPADPATNHINITGYNYDAAGNMTADGLHAYSYDAENRIAKVDGNANTFAYDAAGLRINKNGTVYIYAEGHVIAEYASNAAAAVPNAEYIYAGSVRVATVKNGVTTFPYNDHLSTRVTADATGHPSRNYGHFPFGETWYDTNPDKWGFTTYEMDQSAEGGLGYAIGRFDSTRIGRFLSIDPLPGSAGAPQTLNRYAYVGNDPINATDPTGLLWKDDSSFYCLLNDLGDVTAVCARKPGSGPSDQTTFMFESFESQNFDVEASLDVTKGDNFSDPLALLPTSSPLTLAEMAFAGKVGTQFEAFREAEYVDKNAGESLAAIVAAVLKDIGALGPAAKNLGYEPPISPVRSMSPDLATNVYDTGKPLTSITIPAPPQLTIKGASAASSQGQLRLPPGGATCFRVDSWLLLEQVFRNPAAFLDATSSSSMTCVK